MGHYAYVNEDCIVETVIKCKLVELKKMHGDDCLDKIPGWFKTSYNTKNGVHCTVKKNEEDGVYNIYEPSDTPEKSLRKNFAGVGSLYLKDLDCFIEPQPFPSWKLDTYAGCWIPPISTKFEDITDRRIYWDEELLTWVSYEGEVWNNTLEEWDK